MLVNKFIKEDVVVKVKIEVGNTHFVTTMYNINTKGVVGSITNALTTYKFQYNYKLKRNIMVKDKVYIVHTEHNGEYRFPISTLKDFMITLNNNGIKRDEIEVVNKKDLSPLPMTAKINNKYKLFDYQKAGSNAVIESNHSLLLIDLIMGYGKTLISIYTTVKLGYKTGIVILPNYIDKWVSDILDITDVKEEEIYIVRGGKSLLTLMENGADEYKFIIFSMRTLYNYFKNFEVEYNAFNYTIEPPELMNKLGIGTIINDEAHQEFFTGFKTALYFNVKKFIGLSATLKTRQKDIQYVYNIMYPKNQRISNLVDYDPYIDVIAVNYKLKLNRRVKYKRQQGYSHYMYEESILKNGIFLRDYVNMILHYVKVGYIDYRREGEKLLIYAYSVRMCTIIANYIKEKYPSLDVRRYVEDDPYENIIDADIRVTTVVNGGTGVDIPNLITTIQTISISSFQANLQTIGRLRRIKDRDTKFYYIFTDDIKNQYNMHLVRKEAISSLAKSYTYQTYDKLICSF